MVCYTQKIAECDPKESKDRSERILAKSIERKIHESGGGLGFFVKSKGI